MEKPNNPQEDDIRDSASDEARLQPENTTIDLPEVKDIPGQEFVHVPSLGELADTTISSADEEDVLNGDSLGEDAASGAIDNREAEDEDTIGIP